MIRTFFNLSKLVKPQQLRLYVPKNTYYSTKYLQPWQVRRDASAEYTFLLQSAHNCKMMATYLKENLNITTDTQLCFALHHITELQLDLDAYFYSEIIPIIKTYVANFDRECGLSFARLIKYSGLLKVKDDALWDLFEKRLIQDRLWRYISLHELVQVSHALSVVGKGSDLLFDTLENYYVKHRKSLEESDFQYLREQFKNRGKGSKLLLQVIENPQIEFVQENARQTQQIGQH